MQQPWPDLAFHEDLAACRAVLSGGSRTFRAASLLLPRRVRDPATALYAFCRAADDAIDLDAADQNGGKAAALARLRSGLDAIYAGRPPPTPADRALAEVVARHAIPRALLDGLLEGFARQLVDVDWIRYAIAGATALFWGAYYYLPRRERARG